MSRKNGIQKFTKAIVSNDSSLLNDSEYQRALEEYVLEVAKRNCFCPNCMRVADEMRKRLKKRENAEKQS